MISPAEQYPHTAEELYKIYLERQDLKEFSAASKLVQRRYSMNAD